jgi:hypothetical protein
MNLSTQLMTDAVVAQYIHDISSQRRPASGGGQASGSRGGRLIRPGGALDRAYNAARTRL